MALHLHDLVPMADLGEDARSLIEQVFGDDFYIEDEAGVALTTVRNLRLLGHAKAIWGGWHLLNPSRGRPNVGHLRHLADALTPKDYRRARYRDADAAWRYEDWDHAEGAGSLE